MRAAPFLLLALIVFLMLPATADAQAPPPFEACPQDTRLVNSATIYVPARLPVPDSDSLQGGDQIALFTSDGTCAGVDTWTGQSLAITAYGSDAWSEFGGYDPEEPLQFKVWDASEEVIRVEEGTYALCGEGAPQTCKQESGYAADAFYTLAGFSSAPLPVELVSFEATRDRDAIVLRWRTASETRNKGFEVQHAIGEAAFAKEAFVDGGGAPGEGQAYTLRVEAPLPGRHRFRLKEVDTDGASTYSSAVEVRMDIDASFLLEAPAPNPFTARATFRLAVARDQNVRIAVYDVLGRQVALLHDGPLDAGAPHRFTFEGGAHASGLYLIRATGEFFQATRKATLIR